MADAALDDFYSALLDDDPEKLYEQAPCGYLSTAPDGRIVKVNQTFLTLTGYERDDLVGRKTFAQLLTAGGRIYHETHYAPMLQMQGKAREIALDIVRADGSLLPALVNSILERHDDGAPRVIRAAVFDATDRRSYEQELLRAKQRAEESEERARALAQTLQQTLIPPAAPAVGGLDVAAVYRPAGDGHEVGGDFYDIFETAPGEWYVALGDVCGKGVKAAVVTSLARHTIRAAAVRADGPSSVLTVLNDVLNRHETNRFCTVVLGRLRRSTAEAGSPWELTVCNGGHPLPLLARAGAAPAPTGRPGSLLGILDEVVLHDVTVVLEPGDEILMMSDGVTEGRRGGEWFGEEGVCASMAAHAGSATSIAQGVLADVLEFQEGQPRDDIAVVVVRVPEGTVGR